MLSLVLIILTIFVALIYSFLNGANDRANSIALPCATKALSPVQALIIATVFDMLGAFASTKVAQTIGKGIVSSQNLTIQVLLVGTIGAVLWAFFLYQIRFAYKRNPCLSRRTTWSRISSWRNKFYSMGNL